VPAHKKWPIMANTKGRSWAQLRIQNENYESDLGMSLPKLGKCELTIHFLCLNNE